MESAKRILNRTIEWVCVVLLAVMTILIAFQVVVRHFFSNPDTYTESLSRYMFVWMVIYGSAYMFGLRERTNIGFVCGHMPPETGVVIEILGELMVALFAADVMISDGCKQVTNQVIQMDAALQIPMGITYSVVPVSTRFILFYFVYNEMKLVKKLGEI